MAIKQMNVPQYFGRKVSPEEAFISAGQEDEGENKDKWYAYMALFENGEWGVRAEGKIPFETRDEAVQAFGKKFPEFPIWVDNGDETSEEYVWPYWTEDMISLQIKLRAKNKDKQYLRSLKFRQSKGELPSNKKLKAMNMTLVTYAVYKDAGIELEQIFDSEDGVVAVTADKKILWDAKTHPVKDLEALRDAIKNSKYGDIAGIEKEVREARGNERSEAIDATEQTD